MADTLLEHGTDVQGNVDQGVGTSKAIPYTDHIGYIEHLEHRVTPHPCTSCGGICYGPASDIRDNGLLRFVSKIHYFHIIFVSYQNFQLFRNLFLFNYLTNYVNKYTAGVP